MALNFSDSAEHMTRPNGYPIVFRCLHWMSATVIIWAMVSGFWVGSLPEDSTIRHIIGNFNVSLTTVFIPIFLVRIAMRLFITLPKSLVESRQLERMARLAHLTLYGLTVVVLITGPLCVERPVSIFNMFDMNAIPMTVPHREMLFELHSWSCRMLGMMVLLHIVAVVWHMRAGRNILARMSLRRGARI
jgi:superoxide oxidase